MGYLKMLVSPLLLLLPIKSCQQASVVHVLPHLTTCQRVAYLSIPMPDQLQADAMPASLAVQSAMLKPFHVQTTQLSSHFILCQQSMYSHPCHPVYAIQPVSQVIASHPASIQFYAIHTSHAVYPV